MENNDNRITNSVDETFVSNLFIGAVAYNIPYYQRENKWEKNNIKEVQNILENLHEGNKSSKYLGDLTILEKGGCLVTRKIMK